MKLKLTVCAIIFCLLFSAAPAFAWNSYTHKALWQAAIKDLDLSACDKSQITKIKIRAPVLPDRGGPKSDHNCYKDFCPAMEKVSKKLADAKSEDDVCQKMFELGVASHYYTDSKNPAHQKIVDMSCHAKFENAVDKFIKSGFKGSVAVKCKKSKTTLTFNKSDYDNLVAGIKKDILDAALGE